jgi:hypothetical protein
MSTFNLTKVPFPTSPFLEGSDHRPRPFGGLTEILTDIAKSPTKFLGDPKVWDFDVQNEGSIFILWPTNEKGLNWCYEHLPEDAPRWGLNGYVIEHRYIADIVAGAERDGLVSKAQEECFQEEARRSI